MVSKLALGAIWGYQRYVSPRKGFRCAHSVLHGGTGCSGFAKYAIRDHGFWGAVPHIRQRFRDCKSASETLRDRCAVHSRRADGEDEETEEKRKRRRDRDGPCSCWNDLAMGCLGTSLCAGTSATSQPSDPGSGGGAGDGGSCLSGDVSMPDCTPDCGGCDCAPSCS
jgi:putative component of membrane protein insertase Oxa1/YidC/SpoIIIJ protein YidD